MYRCSSSGVGRDDAVVSASGFDEKGTLVGSAGLRVVSSLIGVNSGWNVSSDSIPGTSRGRFVLVREQVARSERSDGRGELRRSPPPANVLNGGRKRPVYLREMATSSRNSTTPIAAL